jgi:hypothetical protein
MNGVHSHNARPFFDTLRDLRHGGVLEDCADALQAAVKAVDETGKPAKMILEISIKPAARVGGAVNVSDKITTKLPALPNGETILFMTPDNNMVANDPKQQQLELKSVATAGAGEQPLKQVGAAS